MKLNDDENLIIKKAQSGDSEALNLILKNYIKLISLSANNFYAVGTEKEDLIQEGSIGLLKAINSYDETKSSFKSFASLCIRRQIISAIKSANSQKNFLLNTALLTENFSEDCDVEERNYGNVNFVENPEVKFFSKERLKDFLNYTEENLSKFEREVFSYLIRGYSYREISEILSKKIKVIDNAIQRIKKKSEQWIKSYKE